MNTFDASAWIGRWPFSFCDAHTAKSLQAHLRQHGSGAALVSPLDAVFAPEPGPANRDLLRQTRGLKGLVPVPVINPALANWWEEVAVCGADERVRAVRLLPNYHGYRLSLRAVDELVEELAVRGWRLIVQMQLIDARHEFHAMNLKPVPAEALAMLLRRHPALDVLASGMLRPDILKLAPRYSRLLCDLSFAEWFDTMENLAAKVSVRQLAFASHTPLLITAAARAKLDTSMLTAAQKRAVASGNLARWWGR